LLKSPNSTHVVSVALNDAELKNIDEKLYPRVTGIVLRRTPVEAISKNSTAISSCSSIYSSFINIHFI
jgi:hypothetical protein